MLALPVWFIMISQLLFHSVTGYNFPEGQVKSRNHLFITLLINKLVSVATRGSHWRVLIKH